MAAPATFPVLGRDGNFERDAVGTTNREIDNNQQQTLDCCRAIPRSTIETDWEDALVENSIMKIGKRIYFVA